MVPYVRGSGPIAGYRPATEKRTEARTSGFQAPPEDDPRWRNRMACSSEDPELFFPLGNGGPALRQIEDAKTVCRRCDVREQCLRWALEGGQDAGIWGDMSEDERRALKRRQAKDRQHAARMGGSS